MELRKKVEHIRAILSDNPGKKVEDTTQKLKEWLLLQPVKVSSAYFDKMTEEILAIRGIRYCAVRDAYGDVLAGGQRSGVSHIETQEELEDFSAYRVSLISSLVSSVPASFGKVEYFAMNFQNLTMFVFPLDKGNILHVTTEPSVTSELLHAVPAILSKFQRKL